MSRDAFKLKLSLLGWSQEEIGQLFGMSHQAVSQIASSLNELKSVAIADFFEKKKKVSGLGLVSPLRTLHSVSSLQQMQLQLQDTSFLRKHNVCKVWALRE